MLRLVLVRVLHVVCSLPTLQRDEVSRTAAGEPEGTRTQVARAAADARRSALQLLNCCPLLHSTQVRSRSLSISTPFCLLSSATPYLALSHVSALLSSLLQVHDTVLCVQFRYLIHFTTPLHSSVARLLCSGGWWWRLPLQHHADSF